MRVPIEAGCDGVVTACLWLHHPLKMRVPIEATHRHQDSTPDRRGHHPLKMRVPIEAGEEEPAPRVVFDASPSENEGPY